MPPYRNKINACYYVTSPSIGKIRTLKLMICCLTCRKNCILAHWWVNKSSK